MFAPCQDDAARGHGGGELVSNEIDTGISEERHLEQRIAGTVRLLRKRGDRLSLQAAELIEMMNAAGLKLVDRLNAYRSNQGE